MARIFGHGGFRLLLLSLLEDGPKHGYDLIVALEHRFMGMYRPSSGAVYPRLAALEEEGLITSEESEGKRTYRLTDAGRDELARRRAELDETFDAATSSVRAAMQELQADIRSAVAAVHTEVTDAATEARRRAGTVADTIAATDVAARQAWKASERARQAAVDEAKRVRRMAEDLRRQAEAEARSAARQTGTVGDVAGEVRRVASDLGEGLDALVAEAAGWAAEVTAAVRRRLVEGEERDRLRQALAAGRRAFSDTLRGGDDQSSA